MKNTTKIWCMVFIGILLSLVFCANGKQTDTKEEQKMYKAQESEMKKLEISSPAFAEGDTIPAKYTCDSSDVSPALVWAVPPKGTKSLALICDDPDAPHGTWVHWVLFNIPPTVTSLPEAVAINKEDSLKGAVEGLTDFGDNGYGGPCPPRGPVHRYFFKIYALDKILDLNAAATKSDVEKAMQGHILAMGQLMGTYKRELFPGR